MIVYKYVLDIKFIQTPVHNIWLFNWDFYCLLHPSPSQPKPLPNLLDHPDHLPCHNNVLLQGGFIVEQPSLEKI